MNGFAGQIERAAEQAIAKVRRSVVAIRTGRGFGAGIVWSAGGLLLTNSHVVRSRTAKVELDDGREIEAIVVARDSERDLVALVVPIGGLDPIDRAEEQPPVGAVVLAVGHPLGVRGRAAVGIVSGRGSLAWSGDVPDGLIALDLPLAPGNSGGPITDAEGRFVGVATMIAAPGVALAVPLGAVTPFMEYAAGRLAA